MSDPSFKRHIELPGAIFHRLSQDSKAVRTHLILFPFTTTLTLAEEWETQQCKEFLVIAILQKSNTDKTIVSYKHFAN